MILLFPQSNKPSKQWNSYWLLVLCEEIQLQISDSCKVLITLDRPSFIYSLRVLNEKHTIKPVRMTGFRKKILRIVLKMRCSPWMAVLFLSWFCTVLSSCLWKLRNSRFSRIRFIAVLTQLVTVILPNNKSQTI